MELQELALAMVRAKEVFHEAWVKYFKKLPPLKPSRFWEILEVFQEQVRKRRFEYKRTDGVDDAAWEVMRLALVGEAQYTIDEAIRFAATYGLACAQCDKRYRKLFEFECDSKNDLMDSMPLLGRACLTIGAMSEEDLREQVMEMTPQGFTRRFIAYGENYCEMRLIDAAEKLAVAEWRKTAQV